MIRYAPGETPGIDIAAFNLHTVRESALGAFMDLEMGRPDRAVVLLNRVLDLQYPISSWPWAGTFPVTAEQADPPGDEAVEWLHYDPNWRQFLGCILSMCLAYHEAELPDAIQQRIWLSLEACVHGEPDVRIPSWYTNPNLMHAWLQAHVGRNRGHDDMLIAGETRARMIFERFEKFGDVDEYNSPTYDGIDLFALSIWVEHPPTELFQRIGEKMLDRICERIGVLYHRGLEATCGPYIRAYGLESKRYVSLIGEWLYLAGEPAEATLPPRLSVDTVHVHDLYFLPLFARLLGPINSRLRIEDVTGTRIHVQKFEDSTATSCIVGQLAVGWEYGRRHEFALDQYVPFTAHFLHDAQPCSIGVKLPVETLFIDCDQIDDRTYRLTVCGRDDLAGLRLIVGGRGYFNESEFGIGPLTLRFSSPCDTQTETFTPAGVEYEFFWRSSEVLATFYFASDRDG